MTDYSFPQTVLAVVFSLGMIASVAFYGALANI